MNINKIIRKNSLQDVNDFFSKTDLKVLDLIPGESWNGEFDRLPDREKFFDKEYMLQFLEKTHEKERPGKLIWGENYNYDSTGTILKKEEVYEFPQIYFFPLEERKK